MFNENEVPKRAQPMPEIPREFASLDAALDSLNNSISELRERLTPVLSDANLDIESGNDKSEPHCTTTYGSHIQSNKNRVYMLREFIEEIIHLLEV